MKKINTKSMLKAIDEAIQITSVRMMLPKYHVTHLIDFADNEKEVLDFMIQNTFLYKDDISKNRWKKLVSGMVDRGYLEYDEEEEFYELTDKAYYSGYVQKAYFEKDGQ